MNYRKFAIERTCYYRTRDLTWDCVLSDYLKDFRGLTGRSLGRPRPSERHQDLGADLPRPSERHQELAWRRPAYADRQTVIRIWGQNCLDHHIWDRFCRQSGLIKACLSCV